MQFCAMSILIGRHLDAQEARQRHELEVQEKIWRMVEHDAAGELSELLCKELEMDCKADNLDEFCYWLLEEHGYNELIERHLSRADVEDFMWKQAESALYDEKEAAGKQRNCGRN